MGNLYALNVNVNIDTVLPKLGSLRWMLQELKSNIASLYFLLN